MRELEDIETSGLRQMKGIGFLLNSYFSDLQILRSERSGKRFYHEICVAETKSRRNTRFAANERYMVPPELLFFKFANFTIGAKRRVFLSGNLCS